jgi:hypothetical protein
MLLLPPRDEVGPIGEASHYAFDVALGYWLQDNTAKAIFEKLNFGASSNPVLAP